MHRIVSSIVTELQGGVHATRGEPPRPARRRPPPRARPRLCNELAPVVTHRRSIADIQKPILHRMVATARLGVLTTHLVPAPPTRASNHALLALTPTPTASKPAVDEDIEVLDYAYSFITNPGPRPIALSLSLTSPSLSLSLSPLLSLSPTLSLSLLQDRQTLCVFGLSRGRS